VKQLGIGFFIGFILILVTGCSTKKDAFLNRNYHKISTKYNVLYNGNLALDAGLKQLNSNYEDNFLELLPIEPLKIDVLALPGMNPDSDSSPQEFEKAEEKAVKAIQKHSMLIALEERNAQIDDAYLLLGKARYYSKRFVPALEAFNYILQNYPQANLINETKIWQAKTQIRLQNEELAIDNLKKIFENEKLEKNIIENTHTALAMAYLQTDSLNKVVYHLKKAVESNENKEQFARNLFILGQLYSLKGFNDSASVVFNNLIDFKKAPYKLKIYAQIEKAKNAQSKAASELALNELKKLIKVRENRPYLDVLNYQAGVLSVAENTETALEFFGNSLKNSSKVNLQKELTYEAIGNLHFDKSNYTMAGAYFDSILQITTDENSKRIRSIKRKRNSLEEVIYYETIAKTNDSILKVVALNNEERNAFFSNHINKIKELEETQQKIASKIERNKGKNVISESAGKWYFYNVQTLSFGKEEFTRIWGNRPLEDNWRLSDKTQIVIGNTAISNADKTVLESEKYNLDYYLSQIPSNQIEVEKLKNERDNAYYKLGLIYKEQFLKPNLSVKKLEELIQFKPETAIEVAAKYHLYKMYLDIDSTKAAKFKYDITENYPYSQYAKVILNPNTVVVDDNQNRSEIEYAKVYQNYKAEDYVLVIAQCTEAVTLFEGMSIEPKFALLKAYAISKTQDVTAFKIALENVVETYPNTEEGKKAMEVIEVINKKL
jgi:tetratricopeptide (TPR) repeat protein